MKLGAAEAITMRLGTVGLMVTLALGMVLVPLIADAQPQAKVPRIGFLWTGGVPRPSCSNANFLRGLHELGYVEGR